MIAEGIKKIEELIRKNSPIHTWNGYDYHFGDLEILKPPIGCPVKIASLTGLVDFLKAGKKDEIYNWFCRVESCVKVDVLAKVEDKWMRREVTAFVDVSDKTPCFQYGKHYNQEDFIVQLNQCFDSSDKGLAEVIALVSTINVEDKSGIEDDGISQRVHVKGGVHLKDKATIKNPMKLTPYLTFPEIKPIQQEFILRVYKGRETELALHASESNRWELDVMESVKAHLKEKLPEMLVV